MQRADPQGRHWQQVNYVMFSIRHSCHDKVNGALLENLNHLQCVTNSVVHIWGIFYTSTGLDILIPIRNDQKKGYQNNMHM